MRVDNPLPTKNGKSSCCRWRTSTRSSSLIVTSCSKQTKTSTIFPPLRAKAWFQKEQRGCPSREEGAVDNSSKGSTTWNAQKTLKHLINKWTPIKGGHIIQQRWGAVTVSSQLVHWLVLTMYIQLNEWTTGKVYYHMINKCQMSKQLEDQIQPQQ